MRKLLVLFFIGITGFACEKDDSFEREWPVGTLTDGFCISFNDSIFLNHGDIEYYDFSTHLVYLKQPLPLLQDPIRTYLAELPFTVFALEEPVYSGNFFPAWYSSMPNGPFIQYPSFYPAYVFGIGYMSYLFTTQPDTLTDPREDALIVEALEKYDQYRKGLSLTIDDIDVSSGGSISFSFTVTNNDADGYYILSPEKMGNGLFHYFTNGLYLYNTETGWLTHNEEVAQLESWDSWDPAWLDLLEGHGARTYTINYGEFDEVPPGNYDINFRFPGLTHVDQEDINRSRGRIWLGEISAGSELTVN